MATRRRSLKTSQKASSVQHVTDDNGVRWRIFTTYAVNDSPYRAEVVSANAPYSPSLAAESAIDARKRVTAYARSRTQLRTRSRRNRQSDSSREDQPESVVVDVDGHRLTATRLHARGPFYAVAAPASISHTAVGRRVGSRRLYTIGMVDERGLISVWSPAANSRWFNKETKTRYLKTVADELRRRGIVG